MRWMEKRKYSVLYLNTALQVKAVQQQWWVKVKSVLHDYKNGLFLSFSNPIAGAVMFAAYGWMWWSSLISNTALRV